MDKKDKNIINIIAVIMFFIFFISLYTLMCKIAPNNNILIKILLPFIVSMVSIIPLFIIPYYTKTLINDIEKQTGQIKKTQTNLTTKTFIKQEIKNIILICFSITILKFIKYKDLNIFNTFLVISIVYIPVIYFSYRKLKK